MQLKRVEEEIFCKIWHQM